MKNPLWLFLKSTLLLFTLNFFICLRALPQSQHVIDSLKSLVIIAKDDTSKVKVLIEIGEQYRDFKPDTAFSYYHKALEIAENVQANEFIAQCLIIIGANLQINGAPDKAAGYLERALKISQEIGDKKKMSTCYLNIGLIHQDQGSYDKAVEFYLKSLETAKEINFKKGLSRSYNSLGRVSFDRGAYDESIGYYLQALKIHEETGDKRNMSACYNNIGLVHMDQGSYDKAIEYLQKALAINVELGNNRAISISYLNLGNVYNKQGSADKAIESYNKALTIFEEIGDKRGISETNHNLGEIYLNQRSFNKAAEYYLKALGIYEEIGDKRGMAILGVNLANLNISLAVSDAVSRNQRLAYLNQAVVYGNKSIVNAMEMKLLPTTKDAANALMTAYEKLGDYKKAIEFAGIVIATQDSIFREDKTRAIQDMSTRYETEKKQQQIELQESQLIAKDARIKQQKIFRNALIGGIAAIVLIVVVIAYAYAQKRKDNKKITEQNEKIIKANEELQQVNTLLEEQQEELMQQKEELQSTLENLQKTQEQLVESEKMAAIGGLVAGVAHEINTPVGIGITAISSLQEDILKMARLYEKEEMSHEDFKEFLQSSDDVSKLIRKNLERTASLVQSFKQVSADQITEQQRVFELKEYLNDILASLQPKFRGKKIDIKIDCDDKLKLNSYPGVYAQIFTNLLLNSLQHGFSEKDTGTIGIKADVIREFLKIQYSDDGTGISKKDLPHIFEPFYTSDQQHGAGLGLNIVYNLVRQKLHGTITCESEAGEGVLFRIEVPVKQ
jgi:signal transduction histidine kinase/Tfp pilus assembly protein PilF